MSATHEHHEHPTLMRYTLWLDRRHWWQRAEKIVLMATGSGYRDGRLFVTEPNGVSHSFDASRVRRLIAEPMEHAR